LAREGALAEGLADLLRADRWRALGEEGWLHADRIFSTENAIRAHLEMYEKLHCDKRRNRP
jgi:hypothetical protein